MDLTGYKKRQISQWDFPPMGAFVVYRHHETKPDSMDSGVFEFVFYAPDKSLVTDDASEELKLALKEAEPTIR